MSEGIENLEDQRGIIGPLTERNRKLSVQDHLPIPHNRETVASGEEGENIRNHKTRLDHMPELLLRCIFVWGFRRITVAAQ